MLSVNSKCKISKRNSNLFCSVLEREKKSENLKINSRIRSWFMVNGLSNSISRKPQSQKRQAPVPANKKLERVEKRQSADSGDYFSDSAFSGFEECETDPVDLVNLKETTSSEHPAVFRLRASSPPHVPPVCPSLNLNSFVTCFSVFPFFLNWRHKLKFEKSRLLYVFCAPVY